MKDDIDEIIKQAKVDVLTNVRDAIQPDGLINSDAAINTIKAITAAIDSLILQIQEK